MSMANTDVVAERRLRPIYDWLDNGNNKKAIQEAHKVLKKQPDLLCAQVLKGLALLRLGKHKDCDDILDNVQKKAPADDCTLQAMTICYRELQKVEKICEVYEKAVIRDPHNEELNTHLFMAYVRIGDYKKQQQVALNLFKIKAKNPYYFWGVMSILMQAQSNDEKIAQKVMLPLAERMVKKFIDDGKIEAEQELQLYIMILDMQNKYKESLEVIDSDLGQKVMSYYMLPRKRIKLLQLLENWLDLNIYIKKLILEEPDSYNYYVIYIDSVFKLMNAQTKSNLENNLPDSSDVEPVKTQFNCFKGELLKKDNTIELCIAFLHRCQVDDERPHRLRGPYLASLFLFRKLSEEGYDPSKYLGNVLDLFKEYFERFANKLCCFNDLHQFLPLVQNDYVSLLSSTWEIIKQAEEKEKKQMMMYLTHFEISRFFGIYEMFSVNDKLTHISRLLDFYHDGQQFNVPLAPTDLGCNDTFMILVGHSLFDLYLDTSDLKFVKDAICLLEYAYGFSSSNHHFKLLLLKFYNILGATAAAYKYFQLLEIKHMQYDSLGYLICWSLLYSGQYATAVHLLDNTIKFFNINYKEAADQLTHAYKYGSFEKVNEFLNFKEKLIKSCHFKLVSIEYAILELIHLPSHDLTVQAAQQKFYDLEQPMPDLSHLVDNRDLSLFINFDPDTRRINEKYTKLSFEHDISLIRLRTMMLRCLGASIKVCPLAMPPKSSSATEENFLKVGVGETNSKNLLIFSKCIEELRETQKSYVETPTEEIPKNVLSGLESSKFFLYTQSTFFLPLFIDTVSFAHQFCSHGLNDGPEQNQLEQAAKNSADQFSEVIVDCNKKLQSLQLNSDEVNHRDIFEYLSLVIEMTCVISIICGNMHSLLVATSKKDIPSKNKKKKGKNVAIAPVPHSDDDNNKQVVEKSVLKAFTLYLKSVKDSVKLLENNLSPLESGWTTMENHNPGFGLRSCKSDADNEEGASAMLGISDDKWFQLQSNVNQNLGESFRSSMKRFKNVVENKLEYLSLLILK